MTIRVGPYAGPDMLTGPWDRRRRLLGQVVDSGLDHVFVADHVSFHTGFGMDGLIQAATLAATEPRLTVQIGVYLLALRHPMVVARQVATFSESAPGRLVLGIGVGGEDRHEIEVCGVDPTTRGRRTDAALQILRGVLTGRPFSHHGDHFDLDDALIAPAPDPPVPIVVGGRSDAALARAARLGDGWLAAWTTPQRFAGAVERITAEADGIGRRVGSWRHGLQTWVGVDDDRDRARRRLGKAMEEVYRIPFERFERYCPYGTVEEVAAELAPLVALGCCDFNIQAIAASTEGSIEAVARIKELLVQEATPA